MKFELGLEFARKKINENVKDLDKALETMFDDNKYLQKE